MKLESSSPGTACVPESQGLSVVLFCPRTAYQQGRAQPVGAKCSANVCLVMSKDANPGRGDGESKCVCMTCTARGRVNIVDREDCHRQLCV